MNRESFLKLRAIRARQAETDIFLFFVPGGRLSALADISRLRRGDDGLEGFQRREIKSHVAEIVDFLRAGPNLFPNAVILAISPDVRFEQSRGPRDEHETAISGKLHLPLLPEGRRAAWIVDGQQRALALARAERDDLLVPVVAFVSAEVAVQREQFILVNKAKPLPSRLIDELLPEVKVPLPRDLKARQVPSALVAALAADPDSPFHQKIRRESEPGVPTAFIADGPLIDAIGHNLRPGGALGAYRPGDGLEPLYEALRAYWTAVAEVFANAWAKPPTESRLTHSAGIRAMAALMDPIWTRADASSNPSEAVRAALERLAPHCRWTEGVWEELGLGWSDVQAVPRHIKALTEHLLSLDRELARPSR